MKKNSLFLQPSIKNICIFLFTMIFTLSFSQNNYTIYFQDEIVEIPENIQTFSWNQMPEKSEFDNGYIGWIQFFETPSQSVQNEFKSRSLKLLEYIPHKAYLFHFPENTSVEFLRKSGVRGIIPVDAPLKISKELNYPPFENWAMDGNNILVTLQFHKNVTTQYVIDELTKLKIEIKQVYKNATLIDISIPDNCLEELANLSFVKWIELIVPPDVKDDTRGKSLHRSNSLDTQSSLGNNYTGVGVGVLVRDDGIVGPHIDFQGRLDNSYASGTGQTHGDGVAGIMAGAGNLNPTMRGMAAGADLYVTNYASNFLDSGTQNLIINGDVQITNSSYSNGCNGGYTTITNTVDHQTITYPSLMHVFSGGNSNNNNCGYGAGTQWGNITGGHKQGKNVIATANVYFDGSLVNSSSRGPATDGRIKPDITANGQGHNSTSENNNYLVFGGTSGAAPGIAGVSAQLYELYASMNGGVLPPSALIKAALLNTANDYGNVGPDFKFGWGIVNGNRAGKLIEDTRYFSDNISQGFTNTHTINIPAGTTQVRFMVYWSDPAAAAGANPALVNDLDLVVKDPSNNSFLPWVLDPTPNSINLDTPATTGIDRLNNMEQVLLNNPSSSNYTIEVTGFNVPMGPQEYYVLYEIITDNLTLTYPNGDEHFVPSEVEAIHWDATNTTDNFILEYSTDDGITWSHIATVNSTLRIYSWAVPSTITGEARIRITSGSFQDSSDDNFSIANLVSGLQLTQVCPNEATFSWNAMAAANEYDLYLLGAKYMEFAGSTNTTSITVPLTNSSLPIYYAVAPKNTTLGWEGRRTNALFYSGGLLNCSLANDLALVSINNDPTDFNFVCDEDPKIINITILNSGLQPQNGFNLRYQIIGEPAVVEVYPGTLNSGQQIDFNFSIPLDINVSDDYTLTASIELASDQNANNDEKFLDFYSSTEAISLDFTEDFETNGFPPPGWIILNPDTDDTWEEQLGITGSSGNPTTASFVNNFSYSAQGEEDVFITEIFNLTNATSALLSFDLAKAQYSATYSDVLRVDISTDCGVTFTTIYDKSGMNLSTMPSYITSNWTPTAASHWRTEELDLSAYLGNKVQLKFININGYGNSTYIDNINMEGVLDVRDIFQNPFALYPNPAGDRVFLSFKNIPERDLEVVITNTLGQRVFESTSIHLDGNNTTSFDISAYASGLYFVSVKQHNIAQIKKLVVK